MMDYKDNSKNLYDDGNIPEIDLPGSADIPEQEIKPLSKAPLPESSRPRKDGPGGE